MGSVTSLSSSANVAEVIVKALELTMLKNIPGARLRSNAGLGRDALAPKDRVWCLCGVFSWILFNENATMGQYKRLISGNMPT